MRHDEGDWEPAPESPSVSRSRGELLEILERAGQALPGDAWVAGQRLHYLAEAGRWDEALHVARGCRSKEWWCQALLGYALHGLEEFVAADSAFAHALAVMPEEFRGTWEELDPLLDHDGKEFLESRSTEERAALRDRFWTLADPLLLVVGNERRTEHYARWTAARIRSQAHSTYGMPWGSDLEELLVRYGGEVGWDRARPGPGRAGQGSIIGHHHPDSRSFVPPGKILSSPWKTEPREWVLNEERPKTSYAPAYAPDIEELDAAVYAFRRGDSILVIAALSVDPAGSEAPSSPAAQRSFQNGWEVGLFVLPGAEPPGISTSARTRGWGVLLLAVPAGRHLISVEALNRQEGRALRSRHGLVREPLVPGVPALSDLLLIHDTGAQPASLDEAIPRILTRLRLLGTEALSVGWEVYGLRPIGQPLRYRLSVQRQDQSILRRAGEWLRVLSGGSPVILEWTERGPESVGPVFRAVSLDLPELEPGEYRVDVELSLPGHSAARASRVFEVVR